MATNDDSFGLVAALREARALADAAESEAGLARIADVAPLLARASRDLAVVALRQGQRERAVELFRRAVAIEPQDWLAHANLGVALRGLGRYAEAVAAYDAALAINPGVATTWNNRGNALAGLERFDDAVASFDRAIAAAPAEAAGHVGRGRTLINLARYAEALEALERARSLGAEDAATLCAHGNALLGLNRAEEALAVFDAALARGPDHALSHGGRALALVELFYRAPDPPTVPDIEQAIERALTADPGNHELYYTRALIRLREGRFREGWSDYEHRWGVGHFRRGSNGQVNAAVIARRTDGLPPDDLNGRSILLVAEQGVGDDIMFASLIPDVLARAASVSLICEQRLHRLFANAFPALRLLPPQPEGDPLAEADHVIALGSLGRLFRNDRSDFPGAPYLRPTPDAVAKASAWLGPRTGFRVGVSWRGGGRTTDGHRRSMTPETLAPLLARTDCEVVNLQYGDAAAELGGAIRTPAPGDVTDFDNLAGLVANLDLIVSVQTSLVHLAGALGAPCLAMIPRKPEWRYGALGEQMAWYGSVRLIRQGADGGWGSVIDRVMADIDRRLQP